MGSTLAAKSLLDVKARFDLDPVLRRGSVAPGTNRPENCIVKISPADPAIHAAERRYFTFTTETTGLIMYLPFPVCLMD
jgi:hypothetical protein